MISEQQIQAYERDGYLLGDRVIGDEQVEVLQEEIERVIANVNGPGPQPVELSNLGNEATPLWQIVNIWQASEPFRELAFMPAIVEAAARLSRAQTLRIWHDQIQYKPKIIGGVNHWHQDSPLWGNLEPKTTQVTAWVALDDVAEDNGCMSMVTGSHKWGVHVEYLDTVQPYDALPETFQGHEVHRVLRPVKKGCVHFHHPLTWHGSHANTSGRPRRAIAIHYMTEKTLYRAGENHCMNAFVEVNDGEPLTSGPFMIVYDANRATVA